MLNFLSSFPNVSLSFFFSLFPFLFFFLVLSWTVYSSNLQFAIDPENGIITVASNGFRDIWEFTFKAVAKDKTGQQTLVPVNVSIIGKLLACC